MSRAIDQSFARADVRDLKNRVQSMISRGVVTNVDDALKLQYMDVALRDGEKPTGVERFQNYGFTAHPLGGATEALVVNMQGNPDHPVIIAVDDRRFRMKNIAPGEVAIYDDQGQSVHFKRDGMVLKSPTKVVIECNDINLGGEGGKPVAIEGTVTSDGAVCQSQLATKVKAI